MKLSAALVTASLALAGPASAALSSDQQALIDLEQKLSTATRTGDADTVGKIEDESYTLTNSHAVVSHRNDDLDEIRKRDPSYDVFETHDMQVRVFGDTGVVIGVVSLKGKSGGKPFDVDMRFTDTFVRRAGEWKIVAAQVTPIPK